MNKELINFIIKLFNNNVDRSIKSDEESFELKLNYPNDLIDFEKIKSLKNVKDIVFSPFTTSHTSGILMKFYLNECSPVHAAQRIKMRTERSVENFSTPGNTNIVLNEAESYWVTRMTDSLVKLLPVEFGTLTIDKGVEGYVSLSGLILDEISIIDIKSLDPSFIRSIHLKKNEKQIEIKVTSNICNKKRGALHV